ELDELHHASIRDVELAVEAVRAWIALHAVIADRRQVDRAGQLRDVLRLRVGRRKRADANTILLRERHPADLDVLDPTAVLLLDGDPAARAEIALDVDPVLGHQLFADALWQQVERLLVHRAAGNRVDGAVLAPGVLLEATLEHRHDRRLPAADRAH